MPTSPQQIIRSTLEAFFHASWTFKDFLTEEDVRCRLFVLLQNALQEYNNSSVHSEIRWYGNNRELGERELRYRSDIVILDPNDLSVEEQNNNFKLSSKGYGFDKYHTIIEIKLRRPNNSNSDDKYDEIIRSDVKKLREIRKKTTRGNRGNKKYFVLVFDKRQKRKQLIDIDDTQSAVWDNWTK